MANRNINWQKLKIEYMAGNLSLNQLREKHKIGNRNNFYKHTQGWLQERNHNDTKAVSLSQEKIIDKKAEEWSRMYKSFEKLEKKVNKAMDSPFNKTGDLRNIATTLGEILKNMRLIKGKPTEITESRNLHLEVVKFLEKEGLQ